MIPNSTIQFDTFESEDLGTLFQVTVFKEVDLETVWEVTDVETSCHGPQTNPSLQNWYLPDWNSTWPCRVANLFLEPHLCVCGYLPTCARVVCICSLIMLYVLSAPWSIHQEWHFLPFCVQTKHWATCAICSLWDMEAWLIWLVKYVLSPQ